MAFHAFAMIFSHQPVTSIEAYGMHMCAMPKFGISFSKFHVKFRECMMWV